MSERNIQSAKGSLCLWVFSFLFSIYLILILTLKTVESMQRGPAYVFGIAFLILLFLIIGFISLFRWTSKKYGKEKRNKAIKVVILCIFILFAYMTWDNRQLRKEFNSITVDGIERQYLVHLPSNYSTSNPEIPLLLALHGGGGAAQQYREQTGFDLISEKYNFMVVYPDGLGMLKYTGHVWNSGYLEAGLKAGTDDVGFLTQLIGFILANYNINASEVYMTGHSNGGMMTYRMAGEKSELFKAVAPTSAPIGGKTNQTSDLYTIPTPTTPVSIVHVHGKLDLNVLYEGGYAESGFNVGTRYDLSVDASIQFWVDKNGCDSTATQIFSQNNKIRYDTYANGVDGSSVNLVTLMEQNHFWENMNKEVASEQFYGATSLAELIWILLVAA